MPYRHILIAVVLLSALAAAAVFAVFSKINHRPASFVPSAYFYQNPDRNLFKIRLKVFYAVPSNRIRIIDPDWRELIEPALKDLQRFHNLQLHGLSKVEYEIFPELFVLENDAIYYDTEKTDLGNPEALKRIVPEIERREKDFLRINKDDFLVIGIVYEGVGAAGSGGAFIISRTFLSDPQYRAFSSSLFYHEFGHTLGLPDRYEAGSHLDQPLSNDIMGAGRRRPIDLTYIDRELLKGMGIVK